jgi:hypothetical protein
MGGEMSEAHGEETFPQALRQASPAQQVSNLKARENGWTGADLRTLNPPVMFDYFLRTRTAARHPRRSVHVTIFLRRLPEIGVPIFPYRDLTPFKSA